MNKLKTLLIIGMLSITLVSFASNVSDTSTMALASKVDYSATTSATTTTTTTTSTKPSSTIPIPAVGILFAALLLGAGIFGRRKKKTKTNTIVDAFARTN
ncbi:MAG: LPXTG cell wall anchor domain-containing protein [Thiohalomonadales bacterium]